MSANRAFSLVSDRIQNELNSPDFSNPALKQDDRPSVGKKNKAQKGKRKQNEERKRRVGGTREGRWFEVMKAWQRSQLSQPTHQLVINLFQGEVVTPTSAGQELRKHLDAIRKKVVTAGYPWLAGWVIEVKHGIHAHIVLHLPSNPDFKEQFASWLMKRFSMQCDAKRSPLFQLQVANSGEPVHLGVVSSSKRYRVTGRSGLDGLIDYCGKSIVEDCRKTSRGIVLGRQVGFSSTAGQLAGIDPHAEALAASARWKARGRL